MSRSSALIELQKRLAEKLEAAKDATASVSWLAVEIADNKCLLPLAQIGEIFPRSAISAVPYTQQWFLGVTNLRGNLYGVVDLPLFFRPDADRTASKNQNVPSGSARLITLSAPLEINVALLIDGLHGLRTAQSFETRAAPEDTAPACFGAVLQTKEGESWQEIDLSVLAKEPSFLSIRI